MEKNLAAISEHIMIVARMSFPVTHLINIELYILTNRGITQNPFQASDSLPKIALANQGLGLFVTTSGPLEPLPVLRKMPHICHFYVANTNKNP